ncbi:MAG: glycosyltransferase [Pseudomonadota bacterium]
MGLVRRNRHIRVLMYSHDTFGLGHLRRCREIAHALVEQFKGLHVLIVSGSSIAGAFDFRARVDFIKIPSVIKLYNGEYTSLSKHIDLSDTLAMRRSIIEHAAAHFRPDIFIVDKEPRGLRGELEPTLPVLRNQGCHIVLGLREVLDEPEVVRHEWEKHNALTWVKRYFDSIWVYGSEDFYHPLGGIELPEEVEKRIQYVGFLGRRISRLKKSSLQHLPESFILATAGGGGDGSQLMSQILTAREVDRKLTYPLVMLLGPFMSSRDRNEINYRARCLDDVYVFDFDNQIENIMSKATAVVGMGGYNTFCEIMSFNKRMLIIPRTRPRREQLIRAQRAADFGLLDILNPDQASDPHRMAIALRKLPFRKRPSECDYKIDMDGLQRVGKIVGRIIRRRDRGLRGDRPTRRQSGLA